MLRALTLLCLLFLLSSCSTEKNQFYNGSPTIQMSFYACLYKKSESVPLGPNVIKLPLDSEISHVRTEVEGLRGNFGHTITQNKDCPTRLELNYLQFQTNSALDEKILREKIYPKVNWDIKAQVLVYNKERSADFDPYDVLVTIPIKFNSTQKSTFLGNFEVVEPKE